MFIRVLSFRLCLLPQRFSVAKPCYSLLVYFLWVFEFLLILPSVYPSLLHFLIILAFSFGQRKINRYPAFISYHIIFILHISNYLTKQNTRFYFKFVYFCVVLFYLYASSLLSLCKQYTPFYLCLTEKKIDI